MNSRKAKDSTKGPKDPEATSARDSRPLADGPIIGVPALLRLANWVRAYRENSATTGPASDRSEDTSDDPKEPAAPKPKPRS